MEYRYCTDSSAESNLCVQKQAEVSTLPRISGNVTNAASSKAATEACSFI